MLMLPNALPRVAFGCHAESSPSLRRVRGDFPACVCVRACQRDGWYSQHTQTAGYQQSPEGKRVEVEEQDVGQRLENSPYELDR